jgi:hypothetical protein
MLKHSSFVDSSFFLSQFPLLFITLESYLVLPTFFSQAVSSVFSLQLTVKAPLHMSIFANVFIRVPLWFIDHRY